MKINFEKIRVDIINWYNTKWEQKKNQYPWRIGKKSVYEILIAELSIYRTTAKAITDNKCYQKFLKKFPTLNEITLNRRKEIEDIFRPVGLYNQKADRILELKEKITQDFNSKIPTNKEKLLTIPGIKEYIANAILTFALDKNEVPYDNNLRRIALAVWNIKEDSDSIEVYKELAKPNPKQIYWALFDIGRFHCRKPIPNCEGCPLKKYCEHYSNLL